MALARDDLYDRKIGEWRLDSRRPEDGTLACEVREVLDRRVRLLAELADQQRQRYWAAHRARRGEEAGERARFGCRVRLQKRSFAFEWFRYVLRGAGKLAFTSGLSRGRGTRYAKDRFAEAPEWERGLIGAIEEQLAAIRYEVALIERLHRQLDVGGRADRTVTVAGVTSAANISQKAVPLAMSVSG